MITILPDLPDHVLGAEASGTVTGEDYQTVLAPAVEAYLRDHDQVRLLAVLGPDFTEFAGGAMWDDARLGLSHVRSWKRIAVVTDRAHLRSMVGTFSFMIPGEVRTFTLGELDDAKAWVAA
jgi:hypothetical protein